MRSILIWLCLALPLTAQPVPTSPIQSEAPENAEGGASPTLVERWYVNADRSIWMYGEVRWVAGKALKVAWFRPAAGDLKVTGRRLDGPAPPLKVDIGTGAQYRHRFTPSLLTFPKAGLWQIQARYGKQQATFVLRVKGS